MVQDIIKAMSVRTDLLIVLVGVMGLDILVGCIRAFSEGSFKSKIFREGLAKKLYEIILIIVAYIVDYVLGTNYIGVAVSVMLIGAEAYSVVIENISKVVEIPQPLIDAIDRLKGKKEEVEEDDNGERF